MKRLKTRVIKSNRVRWVRHAARMREVENSYRILVRKYDWKRPLGRPWFRMKYYIPWCSSELLRKTKGDIS
jgi:hypothetical protein